MKLTKTTQDLTRFKPTKIDGIIDEFIAMECDKVKVEMSPYDLTKGRISFRYK